MRRSFKDAWIDGLLWLFPAVVFGVVVARVFSQQILPGQIKLSGARVFDVPGIGMMLLLAGVVLGPLIVAMVTRRLGGFLAGASLVLLVISAMGWCRSHWVTDRDDVWRMEKEAGAPVLHRWSFFSQGGGFSLFHSIWMNERRFGYFRSLVSPGKEGHVSLWSGGSSAEFPSERNLAGGFGFSTTIKWLRSIGFAMEIKPAGSWGMPGGGVAFALALPYWFIFMLALPLPLGWWVRWRRRRPVAVGTCAVCGYDLRATHDADGERLGICPECGAEGSAVGGVSICESAVGRVGQARPLKGGAR